MPAHLRLAAALVALGCGASSPSPRGPAAGGSATEAATEPLALGPECEERLEHVAILATPADFVRRCTVDCTALGRSRVSCASGCREEAGGFWELRTRVERSFVGRCATPATRDEARAMAEATTPLDESERRCRFARAFAATLSEGGQYLIALPPGGDSIYAGFNYCEEACQRQGGLSFQCRRVCEGRGPEREARLARLCSAPETRGPSSPALSSASPRAEAEDERLAASVPTPTLREAHDRLLETRRCRDQLVRIARSAVPPGFVPACVQDCFGFALGGAPCPARCQEEAERFRELLAGMQAYFVDQCSYGGSPEVRARTRAMAEEAAAIDEAERRCRVARFLGPLYAQGAESLLGLPQGGSIPPETDYCQLACTNEGGLSFQCAHFCEVEGDARQLRLSRLCPP